MINTLLFLYSIATTFRDAFSPDVQQNYQLNVFLHQWSGSTWIVIFALVNVVIVFDGAARAIRKREQEIARLSVRPYDEELQRFVRARLAPLGSDERDVLRHFLRFQESEAQKLIADAGINDNEFGTILTRVDETGMLERQERPKVGRASIDLFWRINPQFVEVLRDELFPRENSPRRLFPNE